MTERAVLLDRDGTIIVDHGYISEPSQVELLPGVLSGLSVLQTAGYHLIIISNQSGIGRGLVTEEETEKVNLYLQSLLWAHGIKLRDIYYCPHSPNDRCSCRKPKPGLLLKALREHQIDAEQSYMVGDKWTDVQAAIAAGVKPVLLSQRNVNRIHPDVKVCIVDSLLTWTKLIRLGDL